jgi:dCTP deaminase
VDPGFEGRITLELYNANSLPIQLQAGRRICQLVFCRMDAAAAAPYAGKYQGQSRSVGSRIFLDSEVGEQQG